MREHDPRKYAVECLRQAELTASSAARLMFLDMAQHWLDIAEQNEMIGVLGVRQELGVLPTAVVG